VGLSSGELAELMLSHSTKPWRSRTFNFLVFVLSTIISSSPIPYTYTIFLLLFSSELAELLLSHFTFHFLVFVLSTIISSSPIPYTYTIFLLLFSSELAELMLSHFTFHFLVFVLSTIISSSPIPYTYTIFLLLFSSELVELLLSHFTILLPSLCTKYYHLFLPNPLYYILTSFQ
jgi:hypothetical protein